MNFEWDDAKAAKTLRERGIAFETAVLIFFNNPAISIDARKDYGETRKIAIGSVAGDTSVLVVVFTERGGDTLRVISVRKANSRERKKHHAHH